MKQILIIGASGHGKVIADIAKLNGYDLITFLDDNPNLTNCGHYAVSGTSEEVDRFPNADVFVAVGNASARKQIFEMLNNRNRKIPVLIHPMAVIGEDTVIGKGTVVMAGAVVNPCAMIGTGCIINTCASVDHDCILKDFVHISVGSHIAGTCKIGAKTWVGAGATVSNNISICSDVMIGAGAVVVKNIEESGTYIGVPAKRV